MEMHVEESKVMRNTRKPFLLNIMIYQKWRMCNISTIWGAR
jgi:hypothetical protein